MQRPQAGLARGTIIAGKYRVESALGRGGGGRVYVATHLELGRGVALKVLGGQDAREDQLARFRREASIAATLESDHVAHVTDIGWLEERVPYLVMELLEGNDLEVELGRRGRFRPEVAVDLVLQACAGVAAAHAAGLVHRDIKPGNLFVAQRKGRPPVVKVLDFGISKIARVSLEPSITDETTRLGTPVYMSPEQVRSSKRVDARTDQYALGAVLYELLTGRAPFEADAVTQLFVLIVTTMPSPPSSVVPDLPPGLDAIVLRALAKDADARFHDLAEFAAAIAPYGGALAEDRLAEVRASLMPQSSSQGEGLADARATALARVDAAPPASEDRSTARRIPLPAAAPLERAPSEDSRLNLASSLGEIVQQRRRRAAVTAAGVGAASLVAGAVALFWLGGTRAPAASPSGAALATARVAPTTSAPPAEAATQAATAPPSAPEPPRPTVAPSSEPEPAATDSAPPPRAEAARSAPPRAPQGAKKKTVLDVFGQR